VRFADLRRLSSTPIRFNQDRGAGCQRKTGSLVHVYSADTHPGNQRLM
jgi:hypothetical protein